MSELNAYRKLAKGGWLGSARLWLGSDHVLQVRSLFGFEKYRRFYLRDIQTLIVRRTKVGWICNLVFGLLAAVAGALSALLHWLERFVSNHGAQNAIEVFAWMGGAAGGFFLLLLLINWALGPTCACFVRSQSGWDQLAAPTRLRPARRFLREISETIVAAQNVS